MGNTFSCCVKQIELINDIEPHPPQQVEIPLNPIKITPNENESLDLNKNCDRIENVSNKNKKDMYFLSGGDHANYAGSNLLQYKLSNNKLIRNWSSGICAKDTITFDIYKDQLESPRSSHSMMWLAWGHQYACLSDFTNYYPDYGDPSDFSGPDFENPKDFSPKASIHKACISKDNKYLFTIESGSGTLCQWDIDNQVLDHYYGHYLGYGVNVVTNHEPNY